jgi:hypothetical protein
MKNQGCMKSAETVTARFKEHKSQTTNNHIQLSSMANHMKMKLNGGRRLSEHHFNLQNLKVLKVVTNTVSTLFKLLD